MPPDAAPPHVETAALAEMITPERCALLVVDVQTDFAGPSGAMARIGLDLSGVEPAIDRIERLIDAARSAGVPVAFARVITRPDAEPAALQLLNARKGRPPAALAICREGEPGSNYHRLAPRPGDIEVEKRLFDSFHGTLLEAALRERSVDTLVICGFTTDCCVDATARAAFHRDFNVFIVSDACDAYSEDLHRGALKALQKNVALLVHAESAAAAWSAAAGTR